MFFFIGMDKEAAAPKRVYNRLDFTIEQEEQLIEFVRTHPAIFNPKDSSYKNKGHRDRLFADFGQQISQLGKVILSHFY